MGGPADAAHTALHCTHHHIAAHIAAEGLVPGGLHHFLPQCISRPCRERLKVADCTYPLTRNFVQKKTQTRA